MYPNVGLKVSISSGNIVIVKLLSEVFYGSGCSGALPREPHVYWFMDLVLLVFKPALTRKVLVRQLEPVFQAGKALRNST